MCLRKRLPRTLGREMAGNPREGAAVAEAGVAVVHAPAATLPPAPPLEKDFRCGYGNGQRRAIGVRTQGTLAVSQRPVPTGRSTGYG